MTCSDALCSRSVHIESSGAQDAMHGTVPPWEVNSHTCRSFRRQQHALARYRIMNASRLHGVRHEWQPVSRRRLHFSRSYSLSAPCPAADHSHAWSSPARLCCLRAARCHSSTEAQSFGVPPLKVKMQFAIAQSQCTNTLLLIRVQHLAADCHICLHPPVCVGKR